MKRVDLSFMGSQEALLKLLNCFNHPNNTNIPKFSMGGLHNCLGDYSSDDGMRLSPCMMNENICGRAEEIGLCHRKLFNMVLYLSDVRTMLM